MLFRSVLLYFSYCASGWYIMRGNLAYVGQQYGMAGWFVNDVWAFFLGGLLPFVLYKFISSFVMRSLAVRLVALPGTNRAQGLEKFRRGLDVTVIIANAVLFAMKFMYLALPMYAYIIDMIVNPAVTILAVSGYMLYAFKKDYVEKSVFKIVLMQAIGAFVCVYGLLAILNMLLSVA